MSIHKLNLSRPWGTTKPPIGWQSRKEAVTELGIQAAWLFNEGGGPTVNGVIGNEPAVVGVSEPNWLWKPGKFGTTLYYAAASPNNGLILGTNQYLQFTGDATVAVWYATTVAGNNTQMLIGNWTAAGANNYGLFFHDTGNGSATVEFIVGGNTGCFITINTYNDGLFHRFVGTLRGNLTSLYIDGILQKTNVGTPNIANPTDNWWMGSWSGGIADATGLYDVPMICNKGWTQDQVIRDYAEPFYWMRPRNNPFTIFEGAAAPPTFNAGWAYGATSGVIGAGAY